MIDAAMSLLGTLDNSVVPLDEEYEDMMWLLHYILYITCCNFHNLDGS